MTRLLLDTHTVLWWSGGHPRLSAAGLSVIEEARSLAMSAASLCEIEVKRLAGRLESPPADELAAAIGEHGVEVLDLTASQVVASARLPRHHADPFDRLIIAQAQETGRAVMSLDSAFGAYDVDVVWA